MAEQLDLSVPLTTTVASYKLDSVLIDLRNAQIVLNLSGLNGETPIVKVYNSATTPTGATLLHNLNVGNFSGATSLIKAVYNRLIADGILSGSVSGSPS